jgi:acyl phosphate:glycerol-3-phosphate acyltransferase
MLLFSACVFLAYFVGSLSAGLILSKLFSKPDPRSYGSKNIGATNVLRSGDRRLALLTLILDMLKGYFMVKLALLLTLPLHLAAYVGLAAMLGHCYPIYFAFRGGKAVATGLGVLLALSLKISLFAVLLFVLAYLFFRVVSLASIFATLSTLAPAFYLYIDLLLPLIFMNLIIILRHKDNIKRLIQGQEHRLNQKGVNRV